MNLFASILTTAVITGSIWGLVLTQPAIANSARNLNSKQSVPHITPHKTEQLAASTDQRYLSGVSQTLTLHNVPQLDRKSVV